ncbi:CDP-glycerol--glycerophosphate glycerophosphotransferase [Kineosporia sp. NBRC 101677]|uniref:CDP-glycerol glycerophosphotransferase family protein n=1 Tax=Kineosporia sp. NBRC 101677 TaxID=3032197 RepID=UPI0024A3DB27|nr:CDP-glycerol glycerophosphotransferase family protein [Kineosporia sp. NBRC 101677]GLY19666.1 CDP-glycerol--glycerophosphate glycerophosphotransferase [Kineosporia sp. NBRC 101677]
MRIVYNSWYGRYSDNPKAIYEALLRRGDSHEHTWLADPGREGGFPAGTTTVAIDSPAAIEVLESADLVVSDVHIELEWTKKPGATYVQTWHGTPLKRVHHDVLLAPDGLLDWLSLDVDRWDVLLSPNAYSTEMLRRAFRWEGTVLETGYPRNDVLLSPNAETIRTRVRRSLGIEEGRLAVLYAPTWRDDTYFENGADASVAVALDGQVAEALDCVFLVRLHGKILGGLAGAQQGWIDVTSYPDIAELYLAADVMVTDYSSAMFDFAVTGKPLALYAYDLERYAAEVRGFYFDLSLDPPGPMVSTQDELIGQLSDLDRMRKQYGEAYERFQQKFCYLEDGHAAERLLERLVPRSA